MTETDLQRLTSSIDKLVRIVCCDGEELLAKIHVVSNEEQDVIYDLISSNRESRFQKHQEQVAYRITFREIDRVERV